MKISEASHHNNVHYRQQLLNLFQGDYTGKSNNYVRVAILKLLIFLLRRK